MSNVAPTASSGSSMSGPFTPVRKTVRVNADVAHTFKIFTMMGDWWPAEHSLLPQGSSSGRSVVIEPHSDGRWFERGRDGTECTWGKVIEWSPPKRVILGWQINGQFQYDPSATTEVQIDFIAEGPTTTRVELEHRYFERYPDTGAALRTGVESADGWPLVLAALAKAASNR
jgi:hypothetical protein